MRHKTAEIAAHDTVPSWALAIIELALLSVPSLGRLQCRIAPRLAYRLLDILGNILWSRVSIMDSVGRRAGAEEMRSARTFSTVNLAMAS